MRAHACWCLITKLVHAPCFKSKQYRNRWSECHPSYPAVPPPGGIAMSRLMNLLCSFCLNNHKAQTWALMVVFLHEWNHAAPTVKDGRHPPLATPSFAPSFDSCVIIHCVDEPRLIEVIALWWTFELFPVLSLFWTIPQELEHTPLGICKCFGGWSWVLAGVLYRHTRESDTHSWSPFRSTMPSQCCINRTALKTLLQWAKPSGSQPSCPPEPSGTLYQTGIPLIPPAPALWCSACKSEWCQAAPGTLSSEDRCCPPSLDPTLFFSSQNRFSDYEKRKVRKCLLSSVTFLLIKHLNYYKRFEETSSSWL